MAKKQPKAKRSNCYDPERREIIAWQISEGRKKSYPDRGGLTKCAKEFGMSPQQWSQYESGHRTPEDEKLEQIAEHLGTSVLKLMTPPANWIAIREEWLATRSRSKRKAPKTNRPKTMVEQVRASLPMTVEQVPHTGTLHDAGPTTDTEPQDSANSRLGSHSSKTMECIQNLINVDRLHAEGKISTEDLNSTLKSVDVLISSLRREVNG